MKDRVFIAIPCGRAALDIHHGISLIDTIIDLCQAGMRPMREFIYGNCYVHLCRDLLAHKFMQTDCTHLFYWDDDVAAPADALRRLIAHDRDIIVAPYPKKVAPGLSPQKTWPYALTDGIPDDCGLLECDMVATGFLLIKRQVIEDLYRVHADRTFFHEPYGAEVVNLFPTGLLPDFTRNAHGKHMWWGEDYAFSVYAKRAGYKIWMDPTIPLIHAGRNIWRGDFTKAADAPSDVAHSSAA